jgi:hypothetical protein
MLKPATRQSGTDIACSTLWANHALPYGLKPRRLGRATFESAEGSAIFDVGGNTSIGIDVGLSRTWTYAPVDGKSRVSVIPSEVEGSDYDANAEAQWMRPQTGRDPSTPAASGRDDGKESSTKTWP